MSATPLTDSSEPITASSPVSESSQATQVAPESDCDWGFWRCFASTFATIFLAELGDKTQVTTLLISAQSGHPWVVFLGAGTALIATSLIGVLLGRWLAQRLSARTLDVAAGGMLLAIAVWLIVDILTL